MSKFVLKPSALSKQAAKLEYYADEPGSAKKQKLDPEAGEEKNGDSSTSEGIPAFGGGGGGGNSTAPSSWGAFAATDGDKKLGASLFKSSDPLGAASPASSSQFVFGMNLRERVFGFTEGGDTDKDKAKDLSNGSANLFSTVAPEEKETEKEKEEEESSSALPSSPTASGPSKTLTESAAAYERRVAEEKQEKIRLLSNEAVSTGEESERNVLQVTCKLYAFNAADHSWAERGRGELHLNDAIEDDDGGDGGPLSSRIVIRTQGALRVVLNSRLFPEMTARKVRQKTIEFTALETVPPADGSNEEADINAQERIRIFLINLSSAQDAENLHRHLESRIKALREYKKE